MISDNADHNANVNFDYFLKVFAGMNGKSYDIRVALLEKEFESDIKEIVKEIKYYPDFPSKGVIFSDIWNILKKHEIFDNVCNEMYDLFNARYNGLKITKVAGIESRGFIFGYELARMFGVPFVPVRKAGKLPGKVICEEYKTEYSTTKLEIQTDSFDKTDKVLLVDDIIATGGTLAAVKRAIEKTGASCNHSLALGKIALPGNIEKLIEAKLNANWLIDF